LGKKQNVVNFEDYKKRKEKESLEELYITFEPDDIDMLEMILLTPEGSNDMIDDEDFFLSFSFDDDDGGDSNGSN
jgi:hypothetical protein